MKPKLLGFWLVGVALMALLGSRPVLAISPAFVMVYGEGLPAPVVIELKAGNASANQVLWGSVKDALQAARSGSKLPAGLSGRPYYKLAIFWGRYDMSTAKPEDASQHGRLYLPINSEPAVIVATGPHMKSEPRPIPAELHGFLMGWVLNAADIATAKWLGVPGL